MFSSPHEWVMVFGVLLGVAIISALVLMANRLFASGTQEILVRFIVIVFAALVGVWIVDKVVAFKIHLLEEEVDKSLFELIRTLILMIFSYYFGTKTQEKPPDA